MRNVAVGVKERVRDGWWVVRDWASTHPRLSIAGIGVVVIGVVIGLVVAIVAGNSQGDGRSDVALQDTLVTSNDIPANNWMGWDEVLLDARPDRSSPGADVTADPAECVPGGDYQRAVESVAVSGQWWSGVQYTSVGLQSRATVSVSDVGDESVSAVDLWLARCPKVAVSMGNQRVVVELKALPVQASVYRLAEARVWAQTVTPDVSGASATSTTLTAAGRAGQTIVSVALTFPGELNDDAITTLDTVWRAQTAKVVGRQDAGLL